MKDLKDMVPMVTVDLGEIDKLTLIKDIYNGVFPNLKEFFYTGENAKRYNILDCYASRSRVLDSIPKDLQCKYCGLDSIPAYEKDGQKVDIQIHSDINQIPVRNNSFDIIFMVANRFGYGAYHASIFEIERIMRNNGILICGLSKYIYNRGINQLLLIYRKWQYEKVIEIKYKLIDNDQPVIETSQYFCIYTYKG